MQTISGKMNCFPIVNIFLFAIGYKASEYLQALGINYWQIQKIWNSVTVKLEVQIVTPFERNTLQALMFNEKQILPCFPGKKNATEYYSTILHFL